MQITNIEWLIRYKQSGFSFFNTKSSEKKILQSWTKYQINKPTDEEIKSWIDSPIQNYAIVCGEISDLIVIDVDIKNGGDPKPFQNRGLYEVQTPSGGFHFYCKYDTSLANTKHDNKGILKGVDLQSNKSLAFAPPSFFPKKGGYRLINDAPVQEIPEDLLIKILEALEPEQQAEEYTPYKPIKIPEMGRPGDIFNALATWEQILFPLGWTKVGHQNTRGIQFWRRPGKKNGISASTNWNNYDLFFPYTTSVDGLSQKKGYTKFNLLATLKYDGDYRRTAKELVVENYKIANKLI